METTPVTLLIAVEVLLLYLVSNRVISPRRQKVAVSRQNQTLPEFAKYPHASKLNRKN